MQFLLLSTHRLCGLIVLQCNCGPEWKNPVRLIQWSAMVPSLSNTSFPLLKIKTKYTPKRMSRNNSFCDVMTGVTACFLVTCRSQCSGFCVRLPETGSSISAGGEAPRLKPILVSSSLVSAILHRITVFSGTFELFRFFRIQELSTKTYLDEIENKHRRTITWQNSIQMLSRYKAIGVRQINWKK